MLSTFIMSIENPVLHVYYLNNKSCGFIKQGLYEEATENLKIALEKAREIAMDSCSKRQGRSESVGRPCHPTSVCKEYRDMCQRKPVKLHSASCSESDSFVFRTPVFVDETRCDEDPYVSNASCYIVFNLSLAYHLMALENRDDKEETNKYLAVAKSLYELTFRMQHTHKNDSNSSSDILLTAAVLNNISAVHNALNNKNEMQQCLELLLSSLVLLVDTRCLPPLPPRNSTISSTEEEDHTSHHVQKMLDGFVGNVMHLLIKNPMAASAA